MSPLTTSFIETHDQVELITGRPITFHSILTRACRLLTQLRQHFGTSNSSNMAGLANVNTAENPIPPQHTVGPTISQQAGSTPLPTPRRRTITASGHSLVVHPFAENIRRDSKDDDNVSHTASLTASLAAPESTSEVHRRCKSDVGASSVLKKSLADQQETSSILGTEAPKVKVEIIDVEKVTVFYSNFDNFSMFRFNFV